MADRELAAERLARAVRAGERIAVFGDYDVDGTTSAAILAGMLEPLGGRVSGAAREPLRGRLRPERRALARVLATSPSCSSPATAARAITRGSSARAPRGVDVIVVDHHLVPPEPLPALAFLNPHRPECGFPYKGLCSAGLALSLGAAVRARLRRELDLRQWLDLVALGTIADVAPLDGDNRALVRAGSRCWRRPTARPGVAALRELAKITPGHQRSARTTSRSAWRRGSTPPAGSATRRSTLVAAARARAARGARARRAHRAVQRRAQGDRGAR